MIFIFLLLLTNTSNAEQSQFPTKKMLAWCESQVQKLRNLEGKLNHCRKDSDCELLKGNEDCYGCHRLTNKNSDKTKFRNELKKLTDNNCAIPSFECVAIGKIICENKKCINKF